MVNTGKQARNEERHLKAHECSALVVNTLNRYISIPIQGKLKQKTIIQSLVAMATSLTSIHSIGQILTEIPCETSFRYHLSKLNLDTLEELNHKILLENSNDLIKSGKKYIFAIDFTNDPYYGEIDENNAPYVVKGQLKASTNSFYSYISLYLVNEDRRLTMAVFPVRNGIKKTEYIQRFLNIIAKMGASIKVLCLDRGFYSKEVISFLQNLKVPHIIPVVKHGDEIKRLLSVNHARYVRYTISKHNQPIEVDIAVYAKNRVGNKDHSGRKILGYVVFGISWNPKKVATIYRKRFGIESSYRMRNKVRAKTCTRSVIIRYLYAIIAFLLKNIWVAVKWIFFSFQKRGPRTVDDARFRFDHFRLMIWTAIQKRCGFRNHIPTLNRLI
jgi:putative transposase